MSRVRSLMIGLPIAILTVAGAQAADMPGDYPPPPRFEHPQYPGFKALHG